MCDKCSECVVIPLPAMGYAENDPPNDQSMFIWVACWAKFKVWACSVDFNYLDGLTISRVQLINLRIRWCAKRCVVRSVVQPINNGQSLRFIPAKLLHVGWPTLTSIQGMNWITNPPMPDVYSLRTLSSFSDCKAKVSLGNTTRQSKLILLSTDPTHPCASFVVSM
jgi:hypothetical protein